jgi:hypothetical protein
MTWRSDALRRWTLGASLLLVGTQGCEGRRTPGDAGHIDDAGQGIDALPDAGDDLPTDAGRTFDAGSTLTDAGNEEDASASCSDDDDPLTNVGWAGFCGDRVDDNCTNDTGEICPADVSDTAATDHYGCTWDEPCSGLPDGGVMPEWDCAGTPPEGVVAYASFASNDQVATLCTFIFRSPASGETYYSVMPVFTNGADPFGPDDPDAGRLCSFDYSARRFLFLTDKAEAVCEPTRVVSSFGLSDRFSDPAHPNDTQKLSTRCRKKIRKLANLTDSNATKLFANSQAEADAKLALLDTVEVACIGVDREDGGPIRPAEIFVLQAEAPLVVVPP